MGMDSSVALPIGEDGTLSMRPLHNQRRWSPQAQYIFSFPAPLFLGVPPIPALAKERD